jgi:hypothetical protein
MSVRGFLYPILALTIINAIVPFLMSQLMVPRSDYLNYLLWVNALLIFALILPSRVGEMFMVKE